MLLSPDAFVEAVIIGALAWLIRVAIVIPLGRTIERLEIVLDYICEDHDKIHDTRDITGQLYEHTFKTRYRRLSEEWGHPPISGEQPIQLVDQEIGPGIA